MNGQEFTVRATDARLLELVRAHFAPFRVDVVDDDPPNVYSADCGQEKVLPGGRTVRPVRRLYFGALKIFKGPSLEELTGRLVGSVRDLVTAHTDEFVRMRAGGVVFGGEAVVLPSRPGPHLPALVGLLVANGGGFLGDEMVCLDPVLGHVFGLPFPLLVDSADLGLFPDLEWERGGRRLTGKPEIVQGRTPRRAIAPERLGGTHAPDAPLGRIVIPRFDPGAETTLAPLPRAEALFRLSEAVLNMHIWGDRTLVFLQRLVEQVPVEQLVVGSIPDAADLLLARCSTRTGGR